MMTYDDRNGSFWFWWSLSMWEILSSAILCRDCFPYCRSWWLYLNLIISKDCILMMKEMLYKIFAILSSAVLCRACFSVGGRGLLLSDPQHIRSRLSLPSSSSLSSSSSLHSSSSSSQQPYVLFEFICFPFFNSLLWIATK